MERYEVENVRRDSGSVDKGRAKAHQKNRGVKLVHSPYSPWFVAAYNLIISMSINLPRWERER